jgi:hypothetical protein
MLGSGPLALSFRGSLGERALSSRPPMAEPSPSVPDRRAVLTLLSRDRLAKLVARFKVEVPDRRSSASHVDALLGSSSLDFGELLGAMTRDELRAACEALGLELKASAAKPELVDRLVSGKRPAGAPPAASAKPAPSPPESGALKAALRRFVVDTAGGRRGRNAAREFTAGLLACFGWPDGQPDDATMPAPLSIVFGGGFSLIHFAPAD